MRKHLLYGVVLLVISVGCNAATPAAGDDDPPQDECDGLAARIDACGGKVGAGFGERCRGTRAEEITGLADAPCSTLSRIDTSKWQASTPGRSGQALSARVDENGLCAFTWQCGDGLVCRPTIQFVNRCQQRGTLGEHCWTDGHCASGMSCHWIWHEIEPAPHPGRVCNPHDDDAHPHTPADLASGGSK